MLTRRLLAGMATGVLGNIVVALKDMHRGPGTGTETGMGNSSTVAGGLGAEGLDVW